MQVGLDRLSTASVAFCRKTRRKLRSLMFVSLTAVY